MAIVSIIGPKGGIGKTTLSINTAAALTRALEQKQNRDPVCLVDLDLRLPTVSSILDSHPKKTFFDLFETLDNKTYQGDFLHTLYRILVTFHNFFEGDLDRNHRHLAKSFSLYKTLGTQLFHFSQFEFGDAIYDLFLNRSRIESISQLKELKPVLDQIDLTAFRKRLDQVQANSQPIVEEYVNHIEEYGFSIIGGEVPVLGKKKHRKRINEPAFLVLFLEFLNSVFEKFEHVILDTPAGGISHMSSLMNAIDQVVLVFDMSNTIAINGSIDALHTFIDYYEDFLEEYQKSRLTNLDKAYVNRVIAKKGPAALDEVFRNKKIGIFFNRCEETHEISACLNRLREYLDTLDKFQKYKDRIHIVGMMPQHKIIKITNNRGALFYNKDKSLRARMDLVAESIVTGNESSPTLADDNRDILNYLERKGKPSLAGMFGRLSGSVH